MKKHSRFLWLGILAIISAGCSSVEYVGKKFDPLPEEKPIFFTWEKSEIDPAKYMIIGHGILSAPGGSDRYEIEDQLTQAARERGADAVCVVASRRVIEGVYDLDEDEMLFPQDVPTDAALSKPKEPSPEESQKWGRQVRLQGEYHGRKRVKVRAVFWKDRAVAEPLIRQQTELLESKAAGNWNGDDVLADLPKTPTQEEKLAPVADTSDALPPLMPEALPAEEPAKKPVSTVPAYIAPAVPLMQGPNSTERAQPAVTPNQIFPLP